MKAVPECEISADEEEFVVRDIIDQRLTPSEEIERLDEVRWLVGAKIAELQELVRIARDLKPLLSRAERIRGIISKLEDRKAELDRLLSVKDYEEMARLQKQIVHLKDQEAAAESRIVKLSRESDSMMATYVNVKRFFQAWIPYMEDMIAAGKIQQAILKHGEDYSI